MLFATLLILFVLFILGSFTFLNYQASEVKHRKEILEEVSWQRRHRIPLLLEVIERSGVSLDSRALQKEEMIIIRSRVSTLAYTLAEEIELEKKLTKLLLDLFQKTEKEDTLKSDGLYLALKKEFYDLLEEWRIALNDYNFALQKWLFYYKFPWFKIFGFFSKLRKEQPIQ